MNLLRIAELEAQLARRDARILELEAVQVEPVAHVLIPSKGHWTFAWNEKNPLPIGDHDLFATPQETVPVPDTQFGLRIAAELKAQRLGADRDRIAALNAELVSALAWDKKIRDSVDSLLAQAGYAPDSSARNQLGCMNFEGIKP